MHFRRTITFLVAAGTTHHCCEFDSILGNGTRAVLTAHLNYALTGTGTGTGSGRGHLGPWTQLRIMDKTNEDPPNNATALPLMSAPP